MPFRIFPTEVSDGGFSAVYSPLPAEYGGGGFGNGSFHAVASPPQRFCGGGSIFSYLRGFFRFTASLRLFTGIIFISGEGAPPLFLFPRQKRSKKNQKIGKKKKNILYYNLTTTYYNTTTYRKAP